MYTVRWEAGLPARAVPSFSLFSWDSSGDSGLANRFLGIEETRPSWGSWPPKWSGPARKARPPLTPAGKGFQVTGLSTGGAPRGNDSHLATRRERGCSDAPMHIPYTASRGASTARRHTKNSLLKGIQRGPLAAPFLVRKGNGKEVLDAAVLGPRFSGRFARAEVAPGRPDVPTAHLCTRGVTHTPPPPPSPSGGGR